MAPQSIGIYRWPINEDCAICFDGFGLLESKYFHIDCLPRIKKVPTRVYHRACLEQAYNLHHICPGCMRPISNPQNLNNFYTALDKKINDFFLSLASYGEMLNSAP